MSKLRKLAQGRDCTARIPGICNGNPETVVLAHYRMQPYCGTGIKPDDYIFGAWCCSSCHDECDRRTQKVPLEWARLYHLEGIKRTQAALLAMGYQVRASA